MAEFKLTMKHPHFPDGTEMDVDGVGVVKNGESVTVTQQMQDAWSAQNDGLELKKSLAQNGAVEFNGKNKLVEGTQNFEDVDPEVQKLREADDIREVTTGGEK